jgi:hypothetical protein
MSWNRDAQPSAGDANLAAAPAGFRVTGDAAWDSGSTDYAMFSADGNAAVHRMVARAREMTMSCAEADVYTFVRQAREAIASDEARRPSNLAAGETVEGMGEVFDTMVRETIAGALDEAWAAAYGHRCDQWEL